MKNRKKWQVISAQPALVTSCHPRLVHYLARYTKQAKTITSKRMLQTPALCLYPCNPLYGSGLNSRLGPHSQGVFPTASLLISNITKQ